MLDNAYLTMASFMGLQSDDFNVQENLFTDDHATPTRIVYSKNYDKDMKTSGQNLKKHRAVSSIKVKAQDKMKLLK